MLICQTLCGLTLICPLVNVNMPNALCVNVNMPNAFCCTGRKATAQCCPVFKAANDRNVARREHSMREG